VQTAELVEYALDVVRRMPPNLVPSTVEHLLAVCSDQDAQDEIAQVVDQPLRVAKCAQTGKDYLLCHYNCDGGHSYRSPWSGEYDPPLVEGTQPSARIRRLEQVANEAFGVYRDLYYEAGAISSVYMWDLDDGFAGVALFKKQVEGALKPADAEDVDAAASSADTSRITSAWDSLHIFEARERGRQAHYKLTSTVLLGMKYQATPLDAAHVSQAASITRQSEHDALPLDDAVNDHIGNLGRLVEDSEAKIRALLHDVYFGKMQNIAADLRQTGGGLREKNRQMGVQSELIGMLRLRQVKRED